MRKNQQKENKGFDFTAVLFYTFIIVYTLHVHQIKGIKRKAHGKVKENNNFPINVCTCS